MLSNVEKTSFKALKAMLSQPSSYVPTALQKHKNMHCSNRCKHDSHSVHAYIVLAYNELAWTVPEGQWTN